MDSPPAAPPPDRAGEPGGEGEAWAEVEARWDDPAAHRAYLARFADLDGLTTAGRRYREVLAARPGDTTALAMKAEVLKRATVVGLAMLPRTRPPAATAGPWRRRLMLALAAWMALALAWLIWKLVTGPTL
jgi:hypothetical protein